MTQTFKNEKRYNLGVYVYYLILLLIVTFRTSTQEPGFAERYAFLAAFFIPLLTRYTNIYPACLFCFMTVATYGFAYNYFPYNQGMYVLLSFIGLLFFRIKLPFRILPFFVALFILSSIVNLLSDEKLAEFNYSLLTAILVALYLTKDKQFSSFSLLNCFCLISICLSVIFLLNYKDFMVSFGVNGDMERSSWNDPNYLSCIIGMGIVTALYQLLQDRASRLWNIFWICVIAFPFVAQLMLASRGGILSVVASCIILVFFSNIKMSVKIFVLIVAISFLFWLYTNSYFELLEYRINDDDGTGSGRTAIWLDKLDAFFNCSIIEQIFGIGYVNSFKLGDIRMGFHNDFLALMCNYGIVGFFSFIYILIYPLYKVSRAYLIPTLAFVTYIVVTCMTLEPFSAGRLTYFGFYLMILAFVKVHSTQQI